MPMLDVTFVLLDSMFLDTSGTYTTRAQTIGAHGRASVTETTLPLAAVYTNKDGSLLQRPADGERIEDSITIHSPTKLSAGVAGRTADSVHWAGANYTVTNVANYSTYGAGFAMAAAEILSFDGGTE